jgi:hypothetical protein
MSWIGNIEFIKEQGLVLSEFGISNKSFELIINEL